MLFFRWFHCLTVLSALFILPAKAQTKPGLPTNSPPSMNQNISNAPHNPLQSCAPPKEINSYQKRLEAFQEAVAEDSQNPKLYYNLGVLQARLQQWEESQKSFLQALAHNPNQILTPQIYHQLGNMYACQQQFEKAITQYKQTLRANPQNENAKHNLALSQMLIQQQEQQKQEQSKDNQSEQKEGESQQQQGSSEQKQTASSQENSAEDAQDQQPSSTEPPKDQQEQTASSHPSDGSQEESSTAQTGQEVDENEEEMQASLTRQQAEQLLNAIPENRRKFLKRLLQRQPPPSSISTKNW